LSIFGAPRQIIIRRQDLPDGTPILRGVAFVPAPGEAVLIAGPTGAGKRCCERSPGFGLSARGKIRLGKGRILFLPQRPNLPLGTLASALLYPRSDQCGVPTARFTEVLEDVGLGALAGQLDAAENWSQRLSLGEQQRLAFARILLVEPALLFLDEATSALDEPSDTQLYSLLRTASWRPTVVSVGHRSNPRAFHDYVLDVAAFNPRPEQLLARSKSDLDGRHSCLLRHARNAFLGRGQLLPCSLCFRAKKACLSCVS
jgi:vitamin B12/bleomycin/antimicrobial peptide transport system ATP-binding/permease protein